MKYDDMPTRENNASENEWLSVTFTQSKKIDDDTKEIMEKGRNESVFSKSIGKVKSIFTRKNKKAQNVSFEVENFEAESDINEEIYEMPIVRRTAGNGGKFKSGVKFVWQKSWKPAAACLIIALALVGMRFADTGFVGDVFGYAKETFTSTIANQSEYIDNGNVMTIPSNATVTVVDGDITLTGGSLAINLKQGKIKEITETSVTVSVADNFDITYSNLTEVMVKVGDDVSQYHVLGKYGDSAIVNLVIDGQKIVGVTADGYTIKWTL